MNAAKEISHRANVKTTRALKDMNVDVKIKLSAIWVTLMLFYIYADILGFYSQGVIEKVITGEIGGVQITDAFLFGMALWMAIPSIMVILSLSLRARLNRWLNTIAALVSLITLTATFLVGELSARYVFQALVEGLLMLWIIWQAWMWPTESV